MPDTTAVPNKKRKMPSGLRPLRKGEFRQNPDGSKSTELKANFTFSDGTHIVVPTLWKSRNGFVELEPRMALDAALAYEKKTGKKFPRFKSREELEAFEKRRPSTFEGELAQ